MIIAIYGCDVLISFPGIYHLESLYLNIIQQMSV